jgi:flagellar biosynthesis/type III secretory pathway chaperone
VSETTAQGIARAELEARLLELTSLLAVEYDAIRERDMEQLAHIARDKQLLVESIDVAARSADVSALLTDPDAPAGQQLHALLSRAQQANRTNGAAIESSQLFTTSLLDILRGRAPGERTYTSRGRLGAQAETMTLVRI